MSLEPTCTAIERCGPVSKLRLNRPGKRNALSRQLIQELTTAIGLLASESGVAGIVICGSDTVFSAGADLNEAVEICDREAFAAYSRLFRDLTDSIEQSARPVVAAISGYCFTGGLELALACDWRVADSTATFAITSARIGSVAGFGGTQRLPRIVGPSQAKRLLFAAEPIEADEAERIGLIDVLVPAGEAERYAAEQVALYATRAPMSLAMSKQAVDMGMSLDLNSALSLEAEISARAFASEDKREGMMAFLEKRSPHFRGL